MKFCRNLQRVIDITDPEWAPYWTNYKMLKKFLKKLPSFVPPDGVEATALLASRSGSPDSSDSEGDTAAAGDLEGDTAEDGERREPLDHQRDDQAPDQQEPLTPHKTTATKMSSNPGEVAFFRLLNSELRKCIHFFDRAQLEFEIRESRVREGIDIMRKANSLMVSEKWSLMAKSLYRLYKDLLLLETYAIMTYCSFSKILKKHDKVTRHNTRIAFMKNVVNKANFTHYPKLLGMIGRCESLYDEVSQSLIQEGKLGLYEDERLFINMIHRLNEQVFGAAQEEGADVDVRKERRQNNSHAIQAMNSPTSPLADSKRGGGTSPTVSPQSSTSVHSAAQVRTLQSLVEENSINKSSKEGLVRVQEQHLTSTTVQAATALTGITAAFSTIDKNKRTHSANLPAASTKRTRKE